MFSGLHNITKKIKKDDNMVTDAFFSSEERPRLWLLLISNFLASPGGEEFLAYGRVHSLRRAPKINFFVDYVGDTWVSGTFGFVRSDG